MTLPSPFLLVPGTQKYLWNEQTKTSMNLVSILPIKARSTVPSAGLPWYYLPTLDLFQSILSDPFLNNGILLKVGIQTYLKDEIWVQKHKHLSSMLLYLMSRS